MTKSKRPDESRYINRHLLVSIYKQMKRNPKKLFVMKDFFIFTNLIKRTKYLGTLVSLGVITQEDMIWKAGKNYKTIRKGVGYKFKK